MYKELHISRSYCGTFPSQKKSIYSSRNKHIGDNISGGNGFCRYGIRSEK